jgi:hypothetical protein
VNETIKIRIINVGPNVNHDFYISGLSFFDTLKQKDTTHILFGALEFGEIILKSNTTLESYYYCSIGSHLKDGMKGTFKIIS